VNACEQACVSLASALGPFGEYIILIAAGVVAYYSRRQVRQTRTELGKTKAEAEAYKTAVLSIRPVSEIAQLTIPPLPVVRSGFSPTSSPRKVVRHDVGELDPTALREDSDRPPDEP
jgi:hypothetical protein